MVTNNPMNPYSESTESTRRSVAPPVAKAEVVEVLPNDPDDGETSGFHTVRVRVYGEQSTFRAPVMTPMAGSANVPPVGTDVAVIYGPNEKPWVVGQWYPTDGDVPPPEYMPGERVIGTPLNESYMKIAADGHIEIVTEGRERVDIDQQTASVSLTGANQSIPSGNTDKIQFDTVEEDNEELWDSTNYQMVANSDGLHRIDGSVAIPLPAQNNEYSIHIFVNGNARKRISEQSAVNEELSLSVTTLERLNAGDTVDIRVFNGSGSAKDVLASNQTTEFGILRTGI